MQRLSEDAEFAKKVQAQMREKLKISGGAVATEDVEDEDEALIEEK
ncbi:hypothetical protein [Phormidium tenue]|nr:hypothetical protein [Phormidium tenue]MBD2232104.1 hypothetical protein [Phormidium tenue FACHB-1052]